MIFGAGAREIAHTVSQGDLDYYLALPKNVLWHVIVSKTDISSIGDGLFGLFVFAISGYATGVHILLFLGLAVLTALIMLNFMVITQSLTFYLGNFEEAADEMFNAMLGFTLYPQNVFSGVLKVLMMTVLPAFFVVAAPVSIIRDFSWLGLLSVGGFWALTSVLALYAFNNGLHRYESGNLIGVKR
jgi:ABC-2 type transport system permease protein